MIDVKEDLDEEGWPIIQAFRPMGLEEIFELRRERPPFIVEGLVRERATTVFLTDPHVRLRYFPMHVALSAVSGARLEPFGPGAGQPTLLCLPDGDSFEDSKALSSLFALVASPPQRRRAYDGFRWCHGADDGKGLPQLNTTDGQRALRRSMPKACKLVVLVNLAKYLAEAPDRMNGASFDRFLADLNKEGIAVAIFEFAARPSNAVSAYVSHHHELIRLAVDVAAPVDYGEGFAVKRSKTLSGDMPATLHVWYRQEGELIRPGWDCGGEDRSAMGKQVAIWERQQRIESIQAEAEARGVKISQKTIAEELKVDPATVTRDMKAIRARHRRQEIRRAALPSPADE